MIEFEINGQTYKADKLDARTQFHVSRKIAPIVPLLLPVLGKLQARGVEALKDLAVVGELLEPLAQAFATMPKDDADLVIDSCLAVVKRKQGNSWTPVYANGAIMFSDIELDVLLPLIVRVVRDSLGNFISGFLSNSTETEAPAAG